MTTTAPTLDLQALSERYFAAWADHDPDRIVEMHTEDTQYWSHIGVEPVRGRQAVRDTFAAVFRQFPEFGFEVYRVLYGPDFWILDWALTAVIDGRPVRFDALDVVNVSPDGLVERKDTFIDYVQAQPALTGPSAS
jgi:uncharacterized protein (TIGR02246 family)